MQNTRPEYTSIAELADRSGTSVPCAGNLPVKLDDPDSVWFIDQGAVNLFLVEFKDGVEQAAPQHLLRRESGRLLLGAAPDERDDEEATTLSLIAKGSPGTLLKRLPANLLSEIHPAELAEQIDTWLTAMTDTLSRFASRLPRPTALVEPGLTQTLPPCTLSVRRGVVWVSEPPSGASLFMDMVDQAELAEASGPHEAAIPLTRTGWLTLFDEVTLTGKSTETLAEQGRLLPALASFHAVAFGMERLNRRLAVVDDANLERARTTSRHTAEKAARQRLFNIYDQPIDRDAHVEDTALADALGIIGRYQGIDFRIPERSGPSDSPVGLVDVLDASGVRARRVRFKGEGEWWRGDSTAMLAFRAEDGQPVALLPGMFGRYREVDPGQQAQRPDDGGSRRYTGAGSLDVLSAIAARERETSRLAANRPARIGCGCGADGDCRASGRPDQTAAGTRAWIRCESYRGGRKRRNAVCRGRGAGRVRPVRSTAAPASKHGNDAA